ncbi:MAG TPA: hypothetical protein VKZ44_04360 [Taishania sp.]|nr:hypothetical protein [Taishania sp.]
MKGIIGIIMLLTTLTTFGQLSNLKLKNVVVIGQFDKNEDRYTIESTMTSILKDFNIPSTPSVNYVKTGQSTQVLLSDSVQAILKEKGFDTYVVVSVRGYDRKYNVSTQRLTLKEKLEQGTIREIYRNAAVSVTFEFAFYRNGELVAIDHVKCSNISDRESTLKRFVNNVQKRILKKWR